MLNVIIAGVPGVGVSSAVKLVQHWALTGTDAIKRYGHRRAQRLRQLKLHAPLVNKNK